MLQDCYHADSYCTPNLGGSGAADEWAGLRRVYTGDVMTRLHFGLALSLGALPLAAEAADLGVDYNFIQDNAPAQPAVVGHLQLGIGYFDQDVSPSGFVCVGCGDEEFGLFEGAGRGNVDFGWLNVELEVAGSAAFTGGTSSSSIGTVAHFWGGSESAAFGVVGGVIFPSGDIEYFLGAEAEAYLGAVTLGGDLRYFWEDGSDDLWIARGWAELYLTPNARLGARVDYASYDVADAEEWFAAVTGEYRFAGTPISAWIEGQYSHIDASGPCGGCSVEIETWAGLIGVRVFMDADGTTLHEHDKLVPWQSLNSIR
jgi:hypothetical protein